MLRGRSASAFYWNAMEVRAGSQTCPEHEEMVAGATRYPLPHPPSILPQDAPRTKVIRNFQLSSGHWDKSLDEKMKRSGEVRKS